MSYLTRYGETISIDEIRLSRETKLSHKTQLEAASTDESRSRVLFPFRNGTFLDFGVVEALLRGCRGCLDRRDYLARLSRDYEAISTGGTVSRDYRETSKLSRQPNLDPGTFPGFE